MAEISKNKKFNSNTCNNIQNLLDDIANAKKEIKNTEKVPPLTNEDFSEPDSYYDNALKSADDEPDDDRRLFQPLSGDCRGGAAGVYGDDDTV